MGLAGTLSGGAIMAFLLFKKLMGQDIVAEHGPLMIAGVLALLSGLMMFMRRPQQGRQDVQVE